MNFLSHKPGKIHLRYVVGNIGDLFSVLSAVSMFVIVEFETVANE